ncbi:hypothetical protein [Jiangella asiatica]|uniref:Uncharacterized protein n=1 Tax=Jiangella asiatica TaxID=2530372 RepID=A0A4R5DIC0_9ACTN|nr:hypothetical protein [Jiangella asiatica]TDE13047.1 hypothetical protein E1269_06550 [Jiangella asiatica]
MTVQTLQATVPALRPLRFNFAQVCIWCETRWCELPRCIAMHERSLWAVCDQCDGFGSLGDDGMTACMCTHGLIEATPASAAKADGRALPVRPPYLDEPRFVVNARPSVGRS